MCAIARLVDIWHRPHLDPSHCRDHPSDAAAVSKLPPAAHAARAHGSLPEDVSLMREQRNPPELRRLIGFSLGPAAQAGGSLAEVARVVVESIAALGATRSCSTFEDGPGVPGSPCFTRRCGGLLPMPAYPTPRWISEHPTCLCGLSHSLETCRQPQLEAARAAVLKPEVAAEMKRYQAAVRPCCWCMGCWHSCTASCTTRRR